MRKLVYGFGINDADYVVQPEIDGKRVPCPAYVAWKNMLKRCYSLKFLAKRPTYVGCSVCEEWRSFMTFKRWWDTHNVEGYQLDKDLRVFGNRVYSPATCKYVPQEVNLFFTDSGAIRGEWPIGVYFNKDEQRFKAKISINGKNKGLGSFDCPNEAHQAWRKEKIRLGNLLADKQTDLTIKLMIQERLKLL